jgi:uncharacterized membrane protein YphA (DoxX/SURF4 family)
MISEGKSFGVPSSVAGWTARVRALPVQVVVYWILRIAVAGEFVGHGAAGITANPAWLPYFAVVGIGPATADRLMPLIGTMDICLGLLTLFYPLRAVLLYYTIWGFWTALLRPLAGEGIWELVERAYNYGVPLAFLVLVGPGTSMRTWFVEKALPRWDERTARLLALILRWVTGLMLIGHGGIGALAHKTGWTAHFGVLGIAPETVRSLSLIAVVGWCEIVLGIAVLLKPFRGLVLFVFVWKVGTELLRPLAGEPIWQFVERAGAYAAPLALLVILTWQQRKERVTRTDPVASAVATGMETPAPGSGYANHPLGMDELACCTDLPAIINWHGMARPEEPRACPCG